MLYFKDGVTIIDNNFPFFIINEVDTIATKGERFPYEGVLGLSPDVSGDDYLTLGVPLPIHLKQKGSIKTAIVGIDMHQNTKEQSSLTIGKIDTSKFRNKGETELTLKWFEVPKTSTRFAWRREMRNVFYNGASFDDGEINDAVFDSFYGGLLLPLTEWKPLFDQIQANLTKQGKKYLICDDKKYSCHYQGECKYHSDDWESFHFNFIDDRAYSVTPSSYLIDANDDAGYKICNVAVHGNTLHEKEYILGDVFMQSMYVVLDYENSRFAVNGNYITVDKVHEKEPKNIPSSGNMIWVIIGAVIGVLVVVAITGFIIVKIKNRRLQANLAKYDQLWVLLSFKYLLYTMV